MQIIIKENYDQMSEEASKLLIDLIKSKPNALLGLATGSTPIGLYKNLVDAHKNEGLSFKDIKTVNLDEYIGLPPEHEESYRFFMNEQLFNHIDINKENTFIPNGKAESYEEECKRYEAQLDDLGRQDIQVLGVGENGHIGFNEPSSELEMYTHIANLAESTIHANSRFFDSIEEVPTQAISMGMGSIFKAKHIILLASGKNKARSISSLTSDIITPLIPVSLIKLHPNVTVILDKEAASELG